MITFDGRRPWPGTMNLAAARELDNSNMSHGAFMKAYGDPAHVHVDLGKPMKAASLWQPWASLMALNFKKVETRSWATSHRGPLAIHAASYSFPMSRYSDELKRECCDVFGCEMKDLARVIYLLPRGSVLCIVDLIRIEHTETVKHDLTVRERIFGNYDAGRYAWFTELLQVFKEPIKAKGNQRLWNWQRS